MKPELRAPAKDKETAFTAIDCGADAVYIGAGMFGARKNAPNSLDDIKEVVDYAHLFNVKVYVTVSSTLALGSWEYTLNYDHNLFNRKKIL